MLNNYWTDQSDLWWLSSDVVLWLHRLRIDHSKTTLVRPPHGCLHDGDPKKMAMSFDWSVGHHSMLTRCPLMKSIRVNTLALVDQNLQCIWPSVYKLRQLIERPNLVSRGIYKFSQEMGATTEAECNQLHKAKSTSASALIGCGGRREPDWCLFFLHSHTHRYG